MKTFRFIFLAFAVAFISSCQAEIWEPYNPNIPDISNDPQVQLSIYSHAVVPVDASDTKASTSTDLNDILATINNLNIKVNLSNGQSQYFFCDKTSTPQNTSYIGNNSLDQFASNKLIQLHFDKLKSSQISSIEVLANAGAKLNETTWAEASDSGLYDASKGCMMYGCSTDDITENNHLQTPCKNFNIVLRRTRAMVSVQLKNDGLNTGVSITPQIIRLCNMPNACPISEFSSAEGNKLNAQETIISQEIPLAWGKLEGGKNGFVGFEHTDPTKPVTIPDNMKQYLFYPLENMQGNHNVGNSNHSTKYPSGISSVEEAGNAEKNHDYTYLEIVADYKYSEKSQVKIGGTIIYRFFLGEDPVKNFDVKGNVYYRINLKLKGFGGAKEDGKLDEQGNLVVNTNDASWRVDMQTTDWGFEKDNFVFDAHFVEGLAKVVGTNWKFDKVTNGEGKVLSGTQSWIVLNVKSNKTPWANPTEITKSSELLIKDGLVRFQIQPMTYTVSTTPKVDHEGEFNEDTYKQVDKNFRKMIIYVSNNDPKSPDYQKQVPITIVQYAPITFHVNGELYFLERFEEYDSNHPSGYPWKWQGDALTQVYDKNFTPGNYSYYKAGTFPPKDDIIQNNFRLVPRVENIVPPTLRGGQGEGGAAQYCFTKGQKGYQGADANVYILPSVEVLRKAFEVSSTYNDAWGPFERLYIYSNYWTSDASSKETYYYDANTQDYLATSDREQNMRARAVYAQSYVYTYGAD